MLFQFFEEPSLAFEALLVDAPFGGDAVLVFLLAVRVRRGIVSPRPCPGSVVSLRIATSPVAVANIGKNRLPPGLVV